MKQKLIILLGIVLFIAAWIYTDNEDYKLRVEEEKYYQELMGDSNTNSHICSDSLHIDCDGKCECDGLGCP